MESILDRLDRLGYEHPHKLLYSYIDLNGHPIESYTYASFLRRTKAIAGQLLKDGRFAAQDFGEGGDGCRVAGGWPGRALGWYKIVNIRLQGGYRFGFGRHRRLRNRVNQARRTPVGSCRRQGQQRICCAARPTA